MKLKIYKKYYSSETKHRFIYGIHNEQDTIGTYNNSKLMGCIQEYESGGLTKIINYDSVFNFMEELILELEIESYMDLYQEVIKYIPEELI